eukprot:CAMPEP_0168253072 /NCGR_PEP_ID=MMETSP0141_2-20121125/3972_1 /TAXON_ID=44445 /ORGANISM="Pseudo-nitzschia australis, Strain 10249 10 AB" /LENGTH=83 /DNA_ID=CAMNT_0008189373 /DNA_START=1806 /DNA_END=2053 /DNA_ORIENTATION=-
MIVRRQPVGRPETGVDALRRRQPPQNRLAVPGSQHGPNGRQGRQAQHDKQRGGVDAQSLGDDPLAKYPGVAHSEFQPPDVEHA